MPYAGVRGQRFYYEVGGEGEFVVLLHGVLASADIMEAPATGLASGFRAARFDRRGCGRTTPATDGPVPLNEEADDILALDLKTLEYKPQVKPKYASLKSVKGIEDPGERLKKLVAAVY